MVDLMCCFLVSGVFVLSFICFSPRICVWHVWVIGWDLLYVPLSFLALALSSIPSSSCCRDAQLLGICQSEVLKPHVLGELGLTLEFCFNLSTFDILNWTATEISSFSLSLEVCHVFFSIFMVFRSCFCKFLSSHSGRFLAQGCRHCHGTQIRCIRLPHPCTVRKLQQRNGTSAFRLGCLGPSSPVSEPQQHD